MVDCCVIYTAKDGHVELDVSLADEISGYL